MTPIRWYGTSFLVLFAADALLTLIGAVTGLLGGLQGLVAMMVVLLCVPTAFATALTRQLPGVVFLPPVLMTLWATLLAMPLPLWVGLDGLQLSVGLVQVTLAALCMWQWWRTLRAPMPASLTLPSRLGRLAAMLIGTPLLVAVYTVGSIDMALTHQTDGMIGLGLDGLYVTHRTYTLDAQVVHLIGMIHIGEPEAYHRLFEGIPVENTLVLSEGVSMSEDGALPPPDAENLNYEQVASKLNLTPQAPISALTAAEERNADLALSDFSEPTQALISEITALHSAPDTATFLSRYQAFSATLADDPALIDGLLHDIVTLRNAHLIEELDAALSEYQTVVVPWGAYHMPEMVAAVEGRGFVVEDEFRVTVIRYGTVF